MMHFYTPLLHFKLFFFLMLVFGTKQVFKTSADEETAICAPFGSRVHFVYFL